MDRFVLEGCVDSVESAVAAALGGADRIELCSNLVIGGTTPGEALFRAVRRNADVRVHVLIRPRFGDFCYTDYEVDIIKNEVRRFRELGADGVVIGILKPDGSLNIEQMQALMDAAGDMWVTLHRAFDVCADPYEGLEQAVGLGIKTILTSGQKNVCVDGIKTLKELVKRSEGRIQIQAAAGIGADVIPMIYQETGITAYHMSGKISQDSKMEYRQADVNMGMPGMSEFEIWRTDEGKMRAARRVLDGLSS